MGKTVSRVLILFICAVTAVGIAVSVWNFTSQEKLTNEKTIVIDEKTQTEMDVSLHDICPGMSVSYYINLKANENDRFKALMDFQKTESDSLAAFIDVDILVNGTKISSSKLSEHLGGKQIEFDANFENTSEIRIEIVYSMDLEVGDEAQNTTADFNIVLSADK